MAEKPEPRYELLTEPGARYMRTSAEMTYFLGWLSGLVAGIGGLHESTPGGEDDPLRVEPDERAEVPGPVQTLVRYRNLIFEMMLERAVDSYLTYLSELLTLVYSSRPETLKAKPQAGRGQTAESITLDELLEHSTMDDLLEYVVERRVNDLSYRGVAELSRYLSDRLGFDLFTEPDDLKAVIFAIESRNVIAHNRAVINRTFIRRVPGTQLRRGDVVGLSFDSLMAMGSFLDASVLSIDGRAAEKWEIPRKEELPSAER